MAPIFTVMELMEKDLYTAPSTIKNAGLGLFTKVAIPKGARIIEYKGKVTDWKTVLKGRTFNAYVYYITRNHCIDARAAKTKLARYANDANGLTRIKGLRNNSEYKMTSDRRVFIHAIRNISAGSEILVPYGQEYWDIVKENAAL